MDSLNIKHEDTNTQPGHAASDSLDPIEPDNITRISREEWDAAEFAGSDYNQTPGNLGYLATNKERIYEDV